MLKNLINLLKTHFVKMFMKKNIDYNTWVFSSSYNTKFNYNSRYLFEYVLKNEPNINPVFVINDDEFRERLQEKYGEKYFIETKSFKGIKRALQSGVWFTSAGLPCYGFKLNKKRLIINLWHGVPLKKIALQEESLSKFRKFYFKYLFSKNYSYVLTTSENLIEIMANSFDVMDHQVKVLGQPRNDALFKENEKKEVLKNLYTNLPKYKKIILYAPTFRDDGKTLFFPFENFKQDRLNSFLEEHEIIIFIRTHQSEDTEILNRNFGDRVRLINEDKVEDVMDILNIFDLLITDYSSIYIDFLLTEKPILFLPYDQESYFENRGFNFTYSEVTPGPKPTKYKEFTDEIDKLLNNKTYYLDERREINNYFNNINDNSNEITCAFVKEKIRLK